MPLSQSDTAVYINIDSAELSWIGLACSSSGTPCISFKFLHKLNLSSSTIVVGGDSRVLDTLCEPFSDVRSHFNPPVDTWQSKSSAVTRTVEDNKTSKDNRLKGND